MKPADNPQESAEQTLPVCGIMDALTRVERGFREAKDDADADRFVGDMGEFVTEIDHWLPDDCHNPKPHEIDVLSLPEGEGKQIDALADALEAIFDDPRFEAMKRVNPKKWAIRTDDYLKLRGKLIKIRTLRSGFEILQNPTSR